MLANNDVKQKVLDKIEALFRTQERVLTQSSEGFNYQKAVKELRDDIRMFGAPSNHRAVVKTSTWPMFESIKTQGMEKFEQESTLRDVVITKVEWTTIDTICSLRFSFSNGTSSIQLGDRIKLRETFIFPKDAEIKKIAMNIRGEQEYLETLTFWDANGNELLSIKGENVKGPLKVLEIGKFEHINGI